MKEIGWSKPNAVQSPKSAFINLLIKETKLCRQNMPSLNYQIQHKVIVSTFIFLIVLIPGKCSISNIFYLYLSI